MPGVPVPDIHGMSDKDIKRVLEQAGLRVGTKSDHCTGPDQGSQGRRRRKGHIFPGAEWGTPHEEGPSGPFLVNGAARILRAAPV